MEKRDYFTAPFPQEMSLRGGIHAARRQPGTSISGSDVISSLFNPKLPTSRWTIFKNLIKFPSRSTVEDNPDPHFLDSCFHCKRPLRRDRDIFMYRGDIPFCSEECREEEIKSDELKERRSVFLRAVASRKDGKNISMKSVEIHAAGPAVAG